MAKSDTIPAAKLELYEALVRTIPSVERKGVAMPYTSCNGHMFSFLTSDGTLALRLPETEREAFLKQHRTALCEQHGTVMKEYVRVPAALLKKTAELQTYFEISYGYVSALKPKPTTRKKKKVASKRTASAKTKAGSKKAKKKKSPAKKTATRKSPAAKKAADGRRTGVRSKTKRAAKK